MGKQKMTPRRVLAMLEKHHADLEAKAKAVGAAMLAFEKAAKNARDAIEPAIERMDEDVPNPEDEGSDVPEDVPDDEVDDHPVYIAHVAAVEAYEEMRGELDDLSLPYPENIQQDRELWEEEITKLTDLGKGIRSWNSTLDSTGY